MKPQGKTEEIMNEIAHVIALPFQTEIFSYWYKFIVSRLKESISLIQTRKSSNDIFTEIQAGCHRSGNKLFRSEVGNSSYMKYKEKR